MLRPLPEGAGGAVPMIERENGWYLVGTMVEAVRHPPSRRVLAAGIFAGLLGGVAAAIVVAADTASGGSSPVEVAVLGVGLLSLSVGGSLLWARSRARRARDEYVRALQSPAPDALIDAVNATFRSAGAVPDGDALLAQARALAYALYGARPRRDARSGGATRPPTRAFPRDGCSRPSRAVAAERSAEPAGAEPLRALLAATAPHCVPLSMRAEALASREPTPAGAPFAAVAPAADPGAQERAAKRALLRWMGTKVALWALLLLLFAALWTAFSRTG